ncbi:MAG: hypothetical protein ABJP45_04350, partial [Cyclobacteriaceae bacterium]
MHFKFSKAPVFLLLLFLAACSMPSKNEEIAQDPNKLDFEALADLLMQRMNLQVGEKVLLVGAPGQFDPLVAALNDRITNSPGEYLGATSIVESQPEEWLTPFIVEMAD